MTRINTLTASLCPIARLGFAASAACVTLALLHAMVQIAEPQRSQLAAAQAAPMAASSALQGDRPEVVATAR